jgi:hypothetical protein
MRREDTFRRLDPVDIAQVEHVSSSPVFEELRRAIVAKSPDTDMSRQSDPESFRLQRRPRYRRSVIALAVATAVVVLFVFVTGSPAPQTAKSTSVVTPGKWRLTGYYEPPGWKQSGLGGAYGPMTCPSANDCYLVSGEPTLNTPGQPIVTLNALSVSHDEGATWSSLPVQGVSSFTTALECPDSDGQVCLAGGMQGATAVLLTTKDGGQSWSFTDLPQDAGHLSNLACTSASHCVGVFTASQDIFNMEGNAEVTDDSGVTWTPATTEGALLDSLTCTGPTCISYGTVPSSTPEGPQTYATFYSNDSGASWKIATVPAGFTLTSFEDQVSCGSSSVCWAIGVITPGGLGAGTRAIAESTNGGATWMLVANRTGPEGGSAISCPTTNDCWVGGGGNPNGTAAPGSVEVRVNANGTVTPSESASPPLVWHTSDGGSTWRLTAITLPATFPAGTSPSSLLGIGQLTCPTESVCVAIGQGDVGSRYTATYSNG